MVASSSRQPGRVLTLLSIMVLVGAEVFGVAIAGAWAIAGLFELGDTISYALMALFGLLGAYLLLNLWRRASAIERPGAR